MKRAVPFLVVTAGVVATPLVFLTFAGGDVARDVARGVGDGLRDGAAGARDGMRAGLDGARQGLDGARQGLDGARQGLDGARRGLDEARAAVDGAAANVGASVGAAAAGDASAATNTSQSQEQRVADQQSEVAEYVQQPPGPPAPPAPATVVGAEVTGLGVVPLTREDLLALRGRREALSDQLQSAQGRRRDVVRELEDAPSDAVRAGLEARLVVLDGRIADLETQIAENGKLLSSVEANYPAATKAPPPPPKTFGDYVEDAMPFAFILMLPIAFAAARMLWKRGNKPPEVPISAAAEARFQKLEQAIDAVAIEVERSAESQRFMAKLLRDGQPLPDFSAVRQGEPVRRADG